MCYISLTHNYDSMNKLNGLLSDLEKKYGQIAIEMFNTYGCSACLYDDDCRSCKGNAMGN